MSSELNIVVESEDAEIRERRKGGIDGQNITWPVIRDPII